MNILTHPQRSPPFMSEIKLGDCLLIQCCGQTVPWSLCFLPCVGPIPSPMVFMLLPMPGSHTFCLTKLFIWMRPQCLLFYFFWGTQGFLSHSNLLS